jgi:hypothetical protein
MNQSNSALVLCSNNNLSNQKKFLCRENLICNDHCVARKYWVKELNNFICELDDPHMYEMIHFRILLDRSFNEIKNLQNLIIQKADQPIELNNLLENCEKNFTEISDLSSNFNRILSDFKNTFLEELFMFLNKNEEVFKLSDLILNIKLDKGIVDYGGVKIFQGREKDFLQLAKIVISREFLNLKDTSIKELRTNLLIFLENYSDYLKELESKSNEFFNFISNVLINSLCNFEGIPYEKENFTKVSPIVSRMELNRILFELNEQKVDVNLNKKIIDLENHIFLMEKKSNELINTHRFELEEKNKELENSLRFLEAEKKINENLRNENLKTNKKLDEYLISAKEKTEEIYNLNIEIEILRQKDINYLAESENNNNEINQITEKYESAFRILEEKIEAQDKLIRAQTNENMELKNHIKEERQNHIDLLNEEITNLKNFYENKINLLESNFQQNLRKYEENKNIQDNLINEKLNELENQTKTISDLSVEMNLINDKLVKKSIIVSELEKEKFLLLENQENLNKCKINLGNQIKQNEYLNIRIEELERNLISKENENNQNDYNKLEIKYNELKIKFNEILENNNLIEQEINEKRNKYMILKANNDDLNLKNNNLINENLYLKEQNKITFNVKDTLDNLSDKLEQANNLNSKYEIENLELRSKLNNLNIEIENLRNNLSNKDDNLNQFKYEFDNKKNFEEKNEIVENEYDKSKFSNINNNNENSSLNSTNRNEDLYRKKIFSKSAKKNNNRNNNNNKNKNDNDSNELMKNNYELRKLYCMSKKNGNINNNNSNNNSNKKPEIKNILNSAGSLGSFAIGSYSNNYNVNNINNINKNYLKFLINNQQIQKLKSWLGFINNGKLDTIKFNLLLKASRDGYESKIFKQKCHKKTFTLVVALTSFNKLIGGFTPLSWDEDDFAYVTDFSKRTFLFSLTNNQKYDLINPGYAICNGINIGPVFGGGSDFEIVDECHKRFNNFSGIGHSFDYNETAEEFYGGNKYLIKDYEVYEVSIV